MKAKLEKNWVFHNVVPVRGLIFCMLWTVLRLKPEVLDDDARSRGLARVGVKRIGRKRSRQQRPLPRACVGREPAKSQEVEPTTTPAPAGLHWIGVCKVARSGVDNVVPVRGLSFRVVARVLRLKPEVLDDDARSRGLARVGVKRIGRKWSRQQRPLLRACFYSGRPMVVLWFVNLCRRGRGCRSRGLGLRWRCRARLRRLRS